MVRTVYAFELWDRWFKRFLQSQILWGVLKLHELGYLSTSKLISWKTHLHSRLYISLPLKPIEDKRKIFEIYTCSWSYCVFYEARSANSLDNNNGRFWKTSSVKQQALRKRPRHEEIFGRRPKQTRQLFYKKRWIEGSSKQDSDDTPKLKASTDFFISRVL